MFPLRRAGFKPGLNRQKRRESWETESNSRTNGEFGVKPERGFKFWDAGTHRPFQHDLRVADGLGVGDVRPGHGAAGEAAGEAGDLVGPGRGAAGALAQIVDGDDAEPVHFSWKRPKKIQRVKSFEENER